MMRSELEDLGEVEDDVGPKEEGPIGLGVRRDADDPVEVRCMVRRGSRRNTLCMDG